MLFLIILFVSVLQFSRVVIGEESPVSGSESRAHSQSPRARLDSQQVDHPRRKLSPSELRAALEESAIRDDLAFHRLLATSENTEELIRELLLQSLREGDEIMSLALALELRANPISYSSNFLNQLSQFLENQNTETRLSSVEFLGLLPQLGSALTPSIRRLVFDPSPRIRFRALTALRRVEDTHFETFLVALAAIHDPLPVIQNQAVSVLGNFRLANAEITLFPRFGSVEAKVRKEVKTEKRTSFPSTASSTQALIRELHDQSSEVRAKAAMKISEADAANPEVLRAIAEALKDSDARVRFAAGFALQKFGLSALPAITQASTEEDPRVRVIALQALSNLDPQFPEVRRLIENIFAKEEDPVVQFQASFAMLKIHPDTSEAIDCLIEELPFAHGELKQHILDTLKGSHLELLRGKLLLAAKSENHLLQEEASRLLLQLPPREQ